MTLPIYIMIACIYPALSITWYIFFSKDEDALNGTDAYTVRLVIGLFWPITGLIFLSDRGINHAEAYRNRRLKRLKQEGGPA